jgi:hypothetical protein
MKSTSQDLHMLAVNYRESGIQPEMKGSDGVNVTIN